jgi:hypothetical protein
VAAGDHRSGGGLAGEEYAGQVDPQDLLEVIQRQLMGGRGALDPGAGDGHVKAPVPLDRLGGYRRPPRLVTDVEGDRLGPAEPGRGAAGRGQVDVDADHDVAPGGQGGRGGRPDA